MRIRRKNGTFTSYGSSQQRVIHGETRNRKETREYLAYKEAKRRCLNPHRPGFNHYGKRGIKFLFKSFQEFLASIGRKPSPEHVLDRIDNNGNYEPSNVRWATRSESCTNRRMTPKWRRHLHKIVASLDRGPNSKWRKSLQNGKARHYLARTMPRLANGQFRPKSH